MQVHVLTEPMPGLQLPATVVPAATYGELHPGSSRVPICLHNLSALMWKFPQRLWLDRPCQPSTTCSPSNQDFQRVQSQMTKRMVPGGLGPPGSQRVAQIRAETGQRVAAQMGAPVCMQ